MRSKRSKATEISNKVRQRVKERDGGCIFCQMGMWVPYPQYRFEIMHYINRSQGGLGIEENLAVGCSFHHGQMDNGTGVVEMKGRLAEYLRGLYPGWDDVEKVYSKWK